MRARSSLDFKMRHNLEWQSLKLTQALAILHATHMVVSLVVAELTVMEMMAIATTSSIVAARWPLSSNEAEAAWTMDSREPKKSGSRLMVPCS